MTLPAGADPAAGTLTEEELAAVLAALRVRGAAGSARAAQGGPLADWRRRRLAVLGQSPRPVPRPGAPGR